MQTFGVSSKLISVATILTTLIGCAGMETESEDSDFLTAGTSGALGEATCATATPNATLNVSDVASDAGFVLPALGRAPYGSASCSNAFIVATLRTTGPRRIALGVNYGSPIVANQSACEAARVRAILYRKSDNAQVFDLRETGRWSTSEATCTPPSITFPSVIVRPELAGRFVIAASARTRAGADAPTANVLVLGR